MHIEGSTDLFLACKRQLTVMHLHQSATEHQPQSASHLLGVDTIGSTVEAAEDMSLIAFGNAHTIVGHADDGLATLLPCLEMDMAALTRVFDGVGDEVVEELVGHHWVEPYLDLARTVIERKGYLLLSGKQREAGDLLLKQGLQCHLLYVRLAALLVNLLKIEQARDHLQQLGTIALSVLSLTMSSRGASTRLSGVRMSCAVLTKNEIFSL